MVWQDPSLDQHEPNRIRPVPRRPALWLAAAAMAGIWVDRQWPEISSPASGPVAVALGAVALLWLAFTARKKSASQNAAPHPTWLGVPGLALLLAVAAAFAGYSSLRYATGPGHLLNTYPAGSDWVVIEGIVSEGMPAPASDASRWATGDRDDPATSESADAPGETDPDPPAESASDESSEPASRHTPIPAVFRQSSHAPPGFLLACEWDHTTGRPLAGTIRVTTDTVPPGTEPVRAGERVSVRGRLRTLTGPRNQGEPDLRRLSIDRGIHASLSLKSLAHAVRHGDTGQFPLQQACESAREWMRGIAPRDASGEPHPLFSALVLGDGRGLSRDTRQAFLQSGGIHILVVSGLHIMVMGFGVWLLATALSFGLRTRTVLVAAVSLAFLVLSGMGVPALRASSVVILFAVARLRGRTGDFLNLLAVSALIVLLRSPGDMFTAGFQLSYLCVLVLALFTPKLSWLGSSHVNRAGTLPGAVAGYALSRPRWFLHWLAISMSGSLMVFLFTTPVSHSYWFLVSPVAVPLAVASVPLLFGILSMSLVLVVASPVPALHEPVSMALTWLLDALHWMAEYSAQLPGSHVWLPAAPHWWLVGFMLLALALALSMRRPRLRLAIAAILIAFSALPALLPPPALANQNPRIHFLDVSQGACAVLESPAGLMVADIGSQMRPHVGEWSLVPFLLSRGHTTVDVLLLSHVDADHINGAVSLCERLTVRELWISPAFEDAPHGQEVLDYLAARVGKVRRLAARQHARVGAFEIDVLWPDPEFASLARNQTTRTNASSLVIRASCPGFSALITGDAEDTAAVGMLPELVPTDVLQAPHHGSGFENLPTLLGRTMPKHVVVSSRRGFPSEATLSMLAGRATVWPTYDFGCVTFEAGNAGPVTMVGGR